MFPRLPAAPFQLAPHFLFLVCIPLHFVEPTNRFFWHRESKSGISIRARVPPQPILLGTLLFSCTIMI